MADSNGCGLRPPRIKIEYGLSYDESGRYCRQESDNGRRSYQRSEGEPVEPPSDHCSDCHADWNCSDAGRDRIQRPVRGSQELLNPESGKGGERRNVAVRQVHDPDGAEEQADADSDQGINRG